MAVGTLALAFAKVAATALASKGAEIAAKKLAKKAGLSDFAGTQTVLSPWYLVPTHNVPTPDQRFGVKRFARWTTAGFAPTEVGNVLFDGSHWWWDTAGTGHGDNKRHSANSGREAFAAVDAILARDGLLLARPVGGDVNYRSVPKSPYAMSNLLHEPQWAHRAGRDGSFSSMGDAFNGFFV